MRRGDHAESGEKRQSRINHVSQADCACGACVFLLPKKNIQEETENGTLHFTAGQKEQGSTLMNPGENTCYLRISLVLPDGTTIYTSELVPPGYATAPITLIAPIERGIYRDVTLRYDCFADEAGQEQINGATCKLDIVAK